MGEWFPFLNRTRELVGLQQKNGNTDKSLIRMDHIMEDMGKNTVIALIGYTAFQEITKMNRKMK